MARTIYFEWQAREHEHTEKSADWYWALGIIGTALIIASLLFGNYILALLVLIAGAVLALRATKHPPIHRFQLTDEGLVVGNDLHPYTNMRSFSMFEYIEPGLPPVLSVKTMSWFSPHLLIPMVNVSADAVYEHLLQHVEESEHERQLSDLVAAWLQF